jgi:TetR/AcrR family fatty acid metabolism transcriptional regulator
MTRQTNRGTGIKRQQILDAAIRILNQEQVHRCPVNDIAREAGIAKGTVYLYFSSKEELYFSVLFELTSQLQRIAEDIDARNIPVKRKLRLLLERMGEHLGEHRQILSSLQQERHSLKGKLRGQLHEKFHDVILSISRIVDKGIAQKQLKTYPAPLIGTVFFALASVLERRKPAKGFPELSVTPDMLFDIILNGIEQ